VIRIKIRNPVVIISSATPRPLFCQNISRENRYNRTKNHRAWGSNNFFSLLFTAYSPFPEHSAAHILGKFVKICSFTTYNAAIFLGIPNDSKPIIANLY
jgi:hypothetical protein